MESAARNNKKTGLAGAMRDWMRSRTGTKPQRRFTANQICEALCAPTGAARQTITNALHDFKARGELVGCYSARHSRRQYLYVQDWRAELKGKLNRKIHKAMYISEDFAVTDILRLTGLQERAYIDKIVRQLRKDGHIQAIQRRPCAHGAGAETIYHVVNRYRFKLEVMR